MTPLATRAATSLLAISVLVSCTPGAEVAERADDATADSESSGSSLDDTTGAVHPAIAALSFTERVEEVGRVEIDGQVWILSQLPAPTVQHFIDEGLAGPDLDPSGGEVLLVDDDLIVHSVPMNAFPPTFIEADDSMVYAGRHGDGGYPDSALVGIDLTTGRVERLVFPHGTSPDPEPGPEWERGTDEQLERFMRREFEGIFP